MKLIYIVEDHQIIRDGVKKYLESAGFSVLGFGNIASAREAFRISKPDLLIQDVMLPDGDGFDFVKELRKAFDFPVIFMTAKVAEEDRIHGFEIGADDYISKPFSSKELVMRVQAILRRTEGTEKNSVKKTEQVKIKKTFKAEDGILVFNEYEHRISVNGSSISLTSAEWRILKLFIDNVSVVLPRSEILKKCFDYSAESYERTADTHIKNLRAKLGNYPWIETVRGYGYRFIAFPVENTVGVNV